MQCIYQKYLFIILIVLFSPLTVLAGGLDFTTPLVDKVEQEGNVNIIVTIKPSLNFQTILADTSLPDSERIQVISELQSSVLSKLSVSDYSDVQQFDFTPQFAITVNRSALEQLLADENLEISENKISYPLLPQSVPRIFPNHATSPYTGNNEWTVAILDTGVDKYHSFLATGSSRKVVSEACYSGGFSHSAVSSVCPGGVASSTAAGSGAPCSSSIDSGCAHGTHVAGIATGDGTSFDGVARLGKLLAIQVFSKISGTNNCNGSATCIASFSADQISALNRVYALRNTYKIASVNMSLGGGSYSGYCDSDPLKPAVDLLKGVKIATVIATGNDGYTSHISAPGCISTAIAVGSTLDTADTRSSFSNNSTALDLYAPGSSITSSVPGGGFETWNGTSMATPHVAGAWALFRQANPGATVSEIEAILKSSGPIVTENGVSRRRIDVQTALRKLAGSGNLPVMSPVYQLLLKSSSAVNCPIPNGDFESGHVSWTEFSTHGGFQIDQNVIVSSHSGTWYAWLGGNYSDTSYIAQTITVPSSCTSLAFYHWIASEDSCGWDYGYVRINGTTVNTTQLCDDNDTNGWVKKVVDLSAYSGQTVTLQIRAVTDASFNSNWFVDDVSFQ